MTYAQLWERSGWLAARLGALGIGRGDHVAVGQDRSVELVVSLLGVLRAGAAYIPLDHAAPLSRIDGILAEARVRALVCATPEEAGVAPWRDTDPSVRRIPLPGEAPEAPVPDHDLKAAETAYVCYTSGSTGRPKGVRISHRAVHRLVQEPNFCVIGAGDRVSNLANPAFDVTTFELWNTLTAGGTVVVLPSLLTLGVDEWVAMVAEQCLDVLSLPTAVFHTVVRERPDAFAPVGSVVIAGEQLDIGAVHRVLSAGSPRSLVNAYGPTEATTFASYFECVGESLDGLDRVPIGYPIQWTTLHLLDDGLAPVADGDAGELCIGGPGVADGYLDRPELTADRFVELPGGAGRIYRTGDMGRRLPDGAIELQGRRDRQVKLRGFRIELEEVERRAIATGMADSVFVEKVGEGESALLVGFALPAKGNEFAADELNRLLSAFLPDYMVPARWVALREVPVNSTGKADRNRLLAMLDAPAEAIPHEVVGSPTTEAAPEVLDEVRRIWCEAFDLTTVRPSDNFIELGGESVLAVEVASLIQERVDPQADAALVLLSDSLAELAAQLRPKEMFVR